MSIWWQRDVRRADRREHAPATTFDQVAAQLTPRSYNEVDVTSAESSLQSVAVFAATDLIASLCSELPLDVFRGEGSERRRLPLPWWLEDPDGSGYGLEDWRYRVAMSWLLRGNVFGDILQRSPGGFLQQVDLFHPDCVSGWLEDGAVKWSVAGQEFTDTARFLHRRVNPVAGQVLGLSPIELHASTLGIQLASTRFGLQWFADGAHPNALLTNSEASLDDDQIRSIKQRFLAALRGTREPLVYGKGWEYKQIQLNPEESQFLETQGYSAAECARIFGPGLAEVLGYSSGGSMTYSNVVDRDLHLLKYALNRWLRRLERLLSAFLPRPQYVKINRSALLETNVMQRYQAYASALNNQWRTVNEVRALEDLAPVPWGDEPNTPPGAAPEAPEPDEAPADEPNEEPEDGPDDEE
ncbi:phage portal protein [Streptomyces halstedii]|uniref:phage portal protein n=1 Tax=Streptomyces halstedii TaxID=1944 RepID=UPI00335A1803